MPVDPLFLSLAEVLEIHKDQITRYGGAVGIRDIGLLKSAIAMPQATFGGAYLHTDLAEMAAAYLYHLVRNHAFIDGNKRVGAVASLVFLLMNGVEFRATNPQLYRMVIGVADGTIEKSEVTTFIREHSVHPKE